MTSSMFELPKSSASPNVNCLEGKRCPICGFYGPFEVVVSMKIMLLDSGTDDANNGTIEYDDGTRTICCACQHVGTFGDFNE